MVKCEGLEELFEGGHELFMCVFLIYVERDNVSVVYNLPFDFI